MTEQDPRCGHCWHQPEWQQCYSDFQITDDGITHIDTGIPGETCVNYKRQPTCGECGHYEAERCEHPNKNWRIESDSKRSVSFVHPACNWPGETHFETAKGMMKRLADEIAALDKRTEAKTAEFQEVAARKARVNA